MSFRSTELVETASSSYIFNKNKYSNKLNAVPNLKASLYTGPLRPMASHYHGVDKQDADIHWPMVCRRWPRMALGAVFSQTSKRVGACAMVAPNGASRQWLNWSTFFPSSRCFHFKLFIQHNKLFILTPIQHVIYHKYSQTRSTTIRE